MNLVVDLNADLGEGAGHDNELLGLVTSANIACGFHAGDAGTIRASIEAAHACNAAVGAHPSLFDRENFGRKELPVKPDEVFDAVVYQLGIFQAIAEACGVRPNHVKPHGALYNMAVRDDGTFKSAEELRSLYQSKGVTEGKEVIAYCRIGERSSHTWYVLHYLLGYPHVRNYDGSWTEWGSLINAPIEK